MKKIFSGILICLFAAPAFASHVDTLTIPSTLMHKNIKCVIVLPNKYASTKGTFPVLYLLHGYSDNYSGWVNKAPNVLRAADDNQMIVVCPDGGYGSWYFDSPVDNNFMYESYITNDVVEYIDKNYRTVKNRLGRAIAGLSMGGHGALFLAIRHKDMFGTCASFSGGVDILPFPNNWDLAKRLGQYNSNKNSWLQHSVQYLAYTLNDGDLDISLDCGVDDFFIGVNRKLHETLDELKIKHNYTERPGEHNWNYWNNCVVYQMYYFRRFFEQNNTAASQ